MLDPLWLMLPVIKIATSRWPGQALLSTTSSSQKSDFCLEPLGQVW